jgi:hypothetical protein
VRHAASALQHAFPPSAGAPEGARTSQHTKVFDNAGLLDEISIDLVPFLLGDGVRLFDHLKGTPIMREDPQVSIVKEQMAGLLRLA